MNSALYLQKIPLRLQVLIFILFLTTAFFSEGFHRGDEHYQLLEAANYIIGKSTIKDLCWEFSSQIRPSVQPYIASCVINLLRNVGVVNPHIWALVLRIITAILSFFVIKGVTKFFASDLKRGDVFYFSSISIWFIIYVSVRFSSETWSALFFMMALLLYFKFRSKKVWYLLIVGALAGLSFELRYQTAIMSFGFFLWLILIEKTALKNLLLMSTGFLLVVVLCTFLDTVFYGEFVFAPYNYFYVNLVEDKVSSFGVNPWYHYIPDLLNKTYVIYGLFILLGMIILLIKKPKSVVNFVVLPFVIFHFLVGHKEMRFIYPVIYFAPFFIAYSIDFLLSSSKERLNTILFQVLKYAHILFGGVLLICTIFFSYKSSVKARNWLSNHTTSTDVLYVIEDNPYSREMQLSFYTTKDEIRVIEIKTPTQIVDNNNGDVYLYTSNRSKEQSYIIPENSVLIFQSMPVLFTKYFNVNGWLDRTTIDKLYKIKNKSNG